jgi:hypothetical protein
MVRRVEASGVAIAGACVGCELATRQTHGYAEQRRTRDALGLFTTSWIGPEANLGPTVTIRLDYRSVLYPGLRAVGPLLEPRSADYPRGRTGNLQSIDRGRRLIFERNVSTIPLNLSTATDSLAKIDVRQRTAAIRKFGKMHFRVVAGAIHEQVTLVIVPTEGVIYDLVVGVELWRPFGALVDLDTTGGASQVNA